MPKYDAFGREIGEDTLESLGGGGEPEAAREAAEPPRPTFHHAPAAAAPAAAPVVRVRRRGGAGCLVAVIVLAAIAAVPIVAIVGIVGSATDAIDDVTDSIESVPDPEQVVPDTPAPAKPPVGIAGESMVARGNLAAALDRLGGMGRAAFIRLSPDRVDAQLVKRRRQRSAVVDFAGDLSRGSATAGGAAAATVALSAIDPSAPARLVRGAAARYAVRVRGINYLVLMPWPGEGHRWIAYFKNGTYVQGDRSGRVVRRIS